MKVPFEGPGPVVRAKNAVLDRMDGCGQEGCHACGNNREAIDELVKQTVESFAQWLIESASPKGTLQREKLRSFTTQFLKEET